MASQLLAHINELSRFRETGKFSDFEMRVGPYAFKVHKIILAASSHYFEVLCGGQFKEAITGFTTLKSDPVMVSRMLQAIYSGDYGSNDHEIELSNMLDRARTDGRSLAVGEHPGWTDEVTYATHIRMYALADEHDIPALEDLAKSKFIAAIHSEDLCLTDLISAIELVYEITPKHDDGLRKWVVFAAQAQKMALNQLADFEDLIKSSADFSWDFATKYGGRSQVWCSNCDGWSKIPSSCTCGFNAMCGSKLCAEVDWGKLRCQTCKKSGHLLREEPREDEDVCIVGAKRSAEAEMRDGRVAKAKKARSKRSKYWS